MKFHQSKVKTNTDKFEWTKDKIQNWYWNIDNLMVSV